MKRDRNVPADDPEAQMAMLQRAQDARLHCWDALAAGHCTMDEARAAARAAGQSDEEIARAAELFAPLDDGLLLSIAARVDGDAPTNVVRPDAGRWQRPAIAAAVAAIAAGLILWMNRAPEPVTVDTVAAAPMVAHELSIRGVAEVRGDAAKLPSVPAGATLPILLRPATKHGVATHVWACAVRGSESIPLDTDVVPGTPGRAIEASVALPPTVVAGEWELVAFVSSTDAPTTGACTVAAADHVAVARSGFLVR
jgi:hypothetical protein